MFLPPRQKRKKSCQILFMLSTCTHALWSYLTSLLLSQCKLIGSIDNAWCSEMICPYPTFESGGEGGGTCIYVPCLLKPLDISIAVFTLCFLYIFNTPLTFTCTCNTCLVNHLWRKQIENRYPSLVFGLQIFSFMNQLRYVYNTHLSAPPTKYINKCKPT